MPTKNVHWKSHQQLIQLLIFTRKEAGLTQTELGQRVGKGQKFISLIERGQRRVDVLEFCVLAKAMGHDPLDLFADLLPKLPKKIEI